MLRVLVSYKLKFFYQICVKPREFSILTNLKLAIVIDRVSVKPYFYHDVPLLKGMPCALLVGILTNNSKLLDIILH